MNILSFTDQHDAFRKRLRDFLTLEVIPNVDKWEADHMVPKEIWQKMGREGFLCTTVSPEYGGMGGDFLYSVIIIEELVRTNQTGLMAQLHSDVVVPYIESYGSSTQKKYFLPGCVSGEIVTAVAMTEPDAGSDLAAMTTTAIEKDDEVILNGNKTFISNGINCDLVVVAAKDPHIENPYKAISLFLVESSTSGFKKGNRLEKMGMHSQDTAELFFTNCRIPRENILGNKGEGFLMLMQKLQQERIVCAVWALAFTENILKWTINHYRNMEPFKNSQAEQFSLVEMKTEFQVGKIFLHHLINEHMRQNKVILETSMAKYWVTEMANRVANRCLTLIGSSAIREDCPPVRMWRDVRVQTIFAGTNEIMKGIIAKSMNLQPI